MPRNYEIKPLSPDGAALAYPIIRSARPEISLDEWVEYAAKVHRRKIGQTGIVVVENQLGYIHGMFDYMVIAALPHGQVLNIDNFIALDAGDRAAAIKLLIEVMEELARKHHCTAIYTNVPDNRLSGAAATTPIWTQLCDAGHAREMATLCKIVPAR